MDNHTILLIRIVIAKLYKSKQKNVQKNVHKTTKQLINAIFTEQCIKKSTVCPLQTVLLNYI